MTTDVVEGTRVVVVGGGAAGVLTSIRLLHVLGVGDRVEVVEPRRMLGEGIAFSTCDEHHLLNVPALLMSAHDDQPDHFVSYLTQQGSGTPTTYAPRPVYSAYLRASLAEAARSSPATLIHHQTTAVRIRPGYGERGVTLELANGANIDSDHVVLTVGWGEPQPVGPASENLIVNPWATNWKGAVATKRGAAAPVAVIGTGLTAADIIGTLARNGHTNIIAISPSGTFPVPHPEILQWPDTGPTVASIAEASTASDVVRRTRAACVGSNWQPVIDGLRVYLPELWKNLPEVERARLLRHALPVWEKLRHRMPPHTARTMRELQATQTLTVIRGRVAGYEDKTLTVHTPAGESALHPALTVVCTGWSKDPQKVGHGLIAHLIDDELVALDGDGLRLTDDGRVAGRLCSHLWAVGLLGSNQPWDNFGVSLLRRQAALIATTLPHTTR